ncbi:MAG: VOC family protein [Actinomycetota bacterium]
MASRFTELVIDCSEPRSVARFWADVLGYRVTEDDDEGVLIEGDAGGAPGLYFIHVPEPKTVKNRLHIDVNPVDRDQDEEVERIVALGARHVDVGQGESSWVVLADPEGNEFCVLRSRAQ